MSDTTLWQQHPCACRFVRLDEFCKSKQTAWCGLHAMQREALQELARYFTSGNSVPIERATIRAEDFWRITGMDAKDRVQADHEMAASAARC